MVGRRADHLAGTGDSIAMPGLRDWMSRGFVAFLVAIGAVAATPAWAGDDDVMAGYYGNTAVVTGGRAETHTVYSADHTFVMTVPAYGMEFKGTWTLDGSNLCRTFEVPPPGVDNPVCAPVEAHKVGDTWTVDSGDDARTFTLVLGVQLDIPVKAEDSATPP